MRIPAFLSTLLLFSPLVATVGAAKLTVDLGNAQGVTFVGAFQRWDQDGNLRKAVNPKAKIDSPEVDAVAAATGDGKWVFQDVPPGKYDLVILGAGRLRVEGWQYAPVLEFDPFLAPDATPEEDAREYIVDDIKKSKHYENKVVPLYLAGDEKVVRVLVMLIRDLPTSYEGEMPGAATMRHEIWQYTWNYGGWVKEKRTRVMDRVILPREELRRWTWVWDSKLGGIEVKKTPMTIQYEVPNPANKTLKGLYPY
jgi:hypothetical protein